MVKMRKISKKYSFFFISLGKKYKVRGLKINYDKMYDNFKNGYGFRYNHDQSKN
jgi:hypothetical protein